MTKVQNDKKCESARVNKGPKQISSELTKVRLDRFFFVFFCCCCFFFSRFNKQMLFPA